MLIKQKSFDKRKNLMTTKCNEPVPYTQPADTPVCTVGAGIYAIDDIPVKLVPLQRPCIDHFSLLAYAGYH